MLWFFLERINLGMAHSLGQLFPPLVYPPLLNLGIAFALSLWGGVGCCDFVLGREIWSCLTPCVSYFVL